MRIEKAGISPTRYTQFPKLKGDTIHLASWCLKENEPEFADHLCHDSTLAKALYLQPGTFRCFGRLPIDRRHTLYLVETYTGMCGTTFLPFMAQRGVDSFALLQIPFAAALYGDNEPEQVGDNISSEEANEVWLLDIDHDGDLDIVYSGWHRSCTAVLGDDGAMTSTCEEEFPKPVVYEWEEKDFQSKPSDHLDGFLMLRHKALD